MDILGISIFIWLPILIAFITFLIAAILYTIVPMDSADVVIQRGKRRTFSSHKDYTDVAKAAYFKIPRWFPGIGMVVHRMPLNILDVPIPDFLAFDVDRARFLCDIVAYAVIKDPVVAAMRFPTKYDEKGKDVSLVELGKQVSKVVQATTRDSTTKKKIREIINDREGIIKTINAPLKEALSNWGLDLRDIELVEFKDPTEKEYGEEAPPHVIKDISSIIEVQINSDARQKNAEQIKDATVKEAEAEETWKKQEIQRDEEIGKRDEQRKQEVAKEAKIAMEEELEVEKVEKVKTQEIEKERALVQANQEKEVEAVNKERKHLDGEGDRLMQTEQAKGKAEFVRQQGYADADAKEKLQAALNKFEDKAIRALIAEKLVEMQENISVAAAKALEVADVRVFSGGQGAKDGFAVGEMIEGITAASRGASATVLNRMARPNDLGFRDFGALLGAYEEMRESEEQEKKAKKTEIKKEVAKDEAKEKSKKIKKVKRPKERREVLP